MAHTYLHPGAKREILRILKEQGYPTYAKLLNLFDVYLTDDPDVIAYMIPNKAVIVINELLNWYQVSTVVRHELLHEYLTHAQRSKAFEKAHPDRCYTHDLSNIAADLEISNRGYTDVDKENMRRIKVGDQTLTALVTEDDFPGWEYKTFEEMYDELTKKYTEDAEKLKQELQPLMDVINKMSPKELDDLIDQAERQASGNPTPSTRRNPQNDSNSEEDEAQSRSKEQSPQAKEQSPQAKELQNKAEEAADELKDIQQQEEAAAKKTAKEPFRSPEEVDAQVARAARVEEITKQLNDIKTKQQLLDETDRVVQKEKIKKIQQKELGLASNPLRRFRMDLQNFIKDQVSPERDNTWHRPNKHYAGSGYIMPGRAATIKNSIPKINVYWDVSGSFKNPAKTAGARAAVATINQYVRRGQVALDAYYFADRVSSTANSAGGGTRGQPILDHIQQTKPTNVIIITDGDIRDCTSEVSVPGAVWMLFFDEESDNLIDHLRGKKQTKHFLIYNY